MKKAIIWTICLISILVTPLFVLAISENDIEVSIDVNESFEIGETVNFDYTITAKSDIEITYLPYVECLTAPQAFLVQETAELKANQPLTKNYQSIKISDFIEPQTCLAYVQILSPAEKRVEKQFEIKTDPSFDLRVLACQDQACQKQSKVYQQGEEVYLKYESSVENVTVKAQVVDPKNKKKEISLPTSYELKKVGKYDFEITGQVEGYKTNKQKLQLVVLDGPPRVIDTKVCNKNNQCEGGENYQNCPIDCPLAKAGLIKNKSLFVLSIVIFLVAVLGLFVLLRRFIKRNKE